MFACFLLLVFVLFETECYCVALAGLEPTMYIRLFAICFVLVLKTEFPYVDLADVEFRDPLASASQVAGTAISEWRKM